MNIYDIAKDEKKKELFDRALDESCRQWCEFIEEAPERKDGEGFADFFYEIFEQKEQEWKEQNSNLKESGKRKHTAKHKEPER